MSKKRQFGELESFIIQKIRIMKKASVSDIHFFIKDSTAYTTVMTVMDRLYKKNILKREKANRSYIYCISDSKYFLKFLDRIKRKIFSGNSIEMISYLLENNTEITDEELNQIDNVIKKIKKIKNNI